MVPWRAAKSHPNKTTICWFFIYFLRAIDRYGGHSALRKLCKGRRDNQWLVGQLLPQRLLFWFSPTTLKLSGRGGAGRVAGSRAGCLWSSFSSLARAGGNPKFLFGGEVETLCQTSARLWSDARSTITFPLACALFTCASAQKLTAQQTSRPHICESRRTNRQLTDN